MIVQNTRKIAFYSPTEGGDWLKWPEDNAAIVDIPSIDTMRVKTAGCKYIVLYQKEIHSLKFTDGEEWDTINGIRIVNMQKSHNQPNNFKARPGITYETNCACGSIYITINTNEVFVRIGKAGGCASALNESVGKLVSAYLQKGGNLDDVIKLLGGVSCHSANKETLSCIGAMAEVLKEHITKGV